MIYSLRIPLFSIFLLSVFGANAQSKPAVKGSHALPAYVSRNTGGYYSAAMKASGFGPRFWLGPKITPVKVKPFPSFPPYISKTVLPYFYPESNLTRDAKGRWRIIRRSAADKKKNFRKEHFEQIGKLFAEQKNKTAVVKLVHALSASAARGDRGQKLELYEMLAMFCMKYGLKEEAEKYYRNALAEQLIAPEYFDNAGICMRLADLLVQQKKYDEALKYIEFARAEFAAAGNRDSLGSCNLAVASIALLENDLMSSEKVVLSEALPFFTAANNDRGRARCFELLGSLYLLEDRYSEAKWFFIQEQTLANKTGDKALLLNSLIGLGRVKVAIKDYSLATMDFKQASRLLAPASTRKQRLDLENAYGQLYLAQGNKKLNQRSLERSKQLKVALSKASATGKKTALELLKYTKPAKSVFIAATATEPIQASSSAE